MSDVPPRATATPLARTLAAMAGLAGAAGVALSAVAAHRVQDAALTTAATLLVVHAGAALAVLALGQRSVRPTGFSIAAMLLLAGSALFAADIAARGLAGGRLFPFAAPTGGATMIAGWLALAVAAGLGRGRKAGR